MLKVKNLQKSLKKQIVLRNINFEVKEGEIFSLFGHNASGKSTLLKILSGIMMPDKGKILLNGKDLFKNNSVKKRICSVFQENLIPSDFKAIDFLLFYSKIVKSNYKKNEIMDFAKDFGIKNEDLKKKISQLSGGTKKKIEFLKSVINNDAQLYLFDEPTIGFDPDSQSKAWNYIKYLKKEGKIIILVTNIEQEMKELSTIRKIIIDGEIKDIEGVKVMKTLEFKVKNWKKHIKEIIEEIKGVEKVEVKAEIEKVKENIQEKFGNANMKIIDLSNTDITVDDVLEKLGVEKVQTVAIENNNVEYIIKVFLKEDHETIQNLILKTFIDNNVQVLHMEVI
ncbi:ABC-type multidrug transport system, ATPase component [Marinitoga piezophila KA3]|uniref:ABC-type multidrug transport system, ATPase component n=1 Tax=Marinitoga piezophila (strain DSM 14283 / JCM 11233 / KA3) TaxID=443254 RepID=H2J356_MARPK|nr:ABC transporter ATP-binding protein [Marinitoga piezophila]AEX84574.1 ABC-type multidrug transport system, ATPase component [Marinitoga piezophila KA3]